MKRVHEMTIKISGVLFLMILGFSPARSQEVKDYDGNIYNTAKYGLQEWMASNLNVSHFRNGDAIPEAKTPEEWVNALKNGTPAWCHYENDPANGEGNGRLYNWYAIADARGLAPEGWHIPGNADWNILIKNLLGIDYAATKLKSKVAWKNRKGTDDIGFSALPSGYRDQDGKFNELGEKAKWWSNSSPVDVIPSDKIYSVVIDDSSYEIMFIQSEKGAGLSVRCRKD